MQSIFRVVFYLRSNYVNKEGKTSVMIRIYLNNERMSLGSSGIFVYPESWDGKSNRIKGRSTEVLQMNLQLDNIKNHIISIYRSVEFDECLSLDYIKGKYLGKSDEMVSLVDLFNAFIAERNKMVGTTITIAPVRKYEVCLKHFLHFLKDSHQRFDLRIKEITPLIINEFDTYLRTIVGHNHNTANKSMKTLKTVISYGNKLGIITIDPFINYKPHSVASKRKFLTDEELMRIVKKDMPIERLAFIKDIFIFSCFTGLAFIDITMLTHGNIVTINGRKWIMTYRHKTEESTNILLLDIPQKIIEKYSGVGIDSNSNKIFPMLSNQKTNAYLKEIADLCGIKKNLTFHMARHTFATMSLSKGVPMESVSRMLGHTNIKTTQLYARITNKKVEYDMDSLAGKLESFNNAMGIQ